jgi:FMN-dependent NADH-azoreductase
MKTLIIKYLPSGPRSHSLKLLNSFTKAIGQHPVETVDLLSEKLPIFSEASLSAYGKRNYMKQELTPSEAATLADHDRLIKQFKAADVIVMAYPMHNFGMPGIVKTYFDAIMFNGETFEMGKKLMAGKKALTLYTAGGIYTPDHVALEYPHWDTLSLNAKINFGFMGFDQSEVIAASLRDPATEAERMNAAAEKITALVKKWYGAK